MNATSKSVSSSRRYTQLTLDRLKAWSLFRPAYWFPVLLCAALGLPESASAVPSYARQTGYACVKCHVGGFGPQLTPYGIKFKINAYTETDHKGLKIPVAGMIMAGFTHTEKDQSPPPLPHMNANDNFDINQISGFLAGRITDDLGIFSQVTYDGVGKGTAIDNVDIRLAHDFVIAKTDVILGLDVNNNPGVSDPGNTQPAWYFPYIGTALVSGTGDAATQLNGALATAVTGVSAYAFVDDSIYAEVGTYRALSDAMAIKFGEGGGIGRVSDAIYWRLNYIKDMNTQAFSAGLIGLNFSIDPSRTDGGPVNRYRDIGLDASYLYLGKGPHNFTAYASYIREDQDHSFDLGPNGGGADNLNDRLYEFRFNTSYYYDQTYGVTVGRFSTHGTRDATVYSFSANGSPDTSGTVLQIDWTPWGKENSWARPFANARLGLQYTIYDKFDGASSNYDGAGRNASDNNTLFLFIWAAI
jgi:hypothetical protein